MSGERKEKKKRSSSKSKTAEQPKAKSEPIDYYEYADKAVSHIDRRQRELGLKLEDFDQFWEHSLPFMERIFEIENERAVSSATPERYKEYLRKWMLAYEMVFKRHQDFKAGLPLKEV